MFEVTSDFYTNCFNHDVQHRKRMVDNSGIQACSNSSSSSSIQYT